MKRNVLLILVVILCVCCVIQAEESSYRDLYTDTWVATDALGRTMPDMDAVGPVKTDQRRVTGIFYITWHRDSLGNLKSPYTADVAKILSKDPSARLDAKNPLWTEGSYHWGEPELGYFLSKDEYVIRKDMSLLADAGVDVLVMDVTNAVRYWEEWDVVFPVMQQMKAEGNKVPQFCFWAYNGPVITVVQDLYDRIYKADKYKDLWFYWDGRPLLLYNNNPVSDANGKMPPCPNPHYDPAAKTDPNHPHYGDPDYAEEFYKDYTKAVKEFFTLRGMWWGYYEWQGERYVGTEDKWSFGLDLGDKRVRDLPLEDLIAKHSGVKEEAAVTPGQHSSSLTGKSWTREHGEPELNEYDLPVPTYVPWLDKTVENPEGYGIYFQDRWEEALSQDPQFIYINDWNEWSAGKYHPGEGKTTPFMRRDSNFWFVDQYNQEFNRGIMPMKGGYTDNYYMQMAQNIRRYKGVRPIPELSGYTEIAVDGIFSDWETAEVEYRDTAGDTAHRDYKGYGSLHYTNNSGRNDFVTCKVAVGEKNVFFLAETIEAITPHTDNNWMLLLIDADQNHDTGWYGYDFLINKNIKDDKTTTVLHYTASGAWEMKADVNYHVTGNQLELAVPRELLGLTGDSVSFDFHWCDNPQTLEDPISLCTDGDSAPNRRFNYRCIWKK